LRFYLVALIYQTPNGWGPIEIRDVSPNRIRPPVGPGYERDIRKEIKPNIYEIPVLLKNCAGLAWKPDGSLTYLSDGKVFSIDGHRIVVGIENSGIAKNPNPNCYMPIPVNNVLAINSDLVAERIQGDRLYWVSDDTFLSRGKDKALYCWHQGKVEKILSSVPEEFSFCDAAPLNVLPVSSGKKRLEPDDLSRLSRGEYPLHIVNIAVHWGGWFNLDQPPLKIDKNQKGLEFAFAKEINIEDIKDPSVYEYKKMSQIMGEGFELRIVLNQILLLRLNGKYTAIKPLEFKWKKYESIDELPKGDWETWKKEGLPLVFWDFATVEWKHWRSVPERELVKEAPEPSKEVAEKKIGVGMSTAGRSEAIGKCMEPDNKYNPRYNFNVTSGDMIITCSAQSIENIDATTNKVTSRRLALSVHTCPTLNGVKCEYVLLPDKTNLEVVTDPRVYQYKTDDMIMGHYVGINRVVILRTGDKCAAIRPIEIRQGPDGISLIYEWKYWPATPQAEAPTSQTVNPK
jgi:hypothetical protein